MTRNAKFGVAAAALSGPAAIAISNAEPVSAQIAIAALYVVLILGMGIWSLRRTA